jgi:hypothetical protein
MASLKGNLHLCGYRPQVGVALSSRSETVMVVSGGGAMGECPSRQDGPWWTDAGPC